MKEIDFNGLLRIRLPMFLSLNNSSLVVFDAMMPTLNLAPVRTAFFVSRFNHLKTEDDLVAFAVESLTHEIVCSFSH